MSEATGALVPITDEIRANISAAANLVAFVFSAIVYLMCLQSYFTTTKWLVIAWVALGGMIAYFGWLVPLLPKLPYHLRIAQDEVPSRTSRQDRGNPIPLYIGVVLNLVIFGLGISASGGLATSPFTSYGPALIAFGLFLSGARWTRIGLLSIGLIWYTTLAFCPWVVAFGKRSVRPETLASHDAGMRWAFWLIGCAVLIISTLVVRRRAVWEGPRAS